MWGFLPNSGWLFNDKGESGSQPDVDGSSDELNLADPCLDASAFAAFAPLLASCEDYARLSGCRFTCSSFDGLGSWHRDGGLDGSQSTATPSEEVVEGESASRGDATSVEAEAAVETPGREGFSQASHVASIAALISSKQDYAWLVAKLRAAPQVRAYLSRLRSTTLEPELAKELEVATQIAADESLRKSMVATCRNLELWPPNPPPPGVDEDDCRFDDVGAAVPVVAQRLFNDEARRRREAAKGLQNRQAETAAFLLNFAAEAGVELPPVPEFYSRRIVEFATRAAAWEELVAMHGRAAAEMGGGASASPGSSVFGDGVCWIRSKQA
eukprot:TRINITY_DN28511_c0_g1_i2.p1 TRINITY_DN28511_c0_g1~~TRINITY_DN28511_c0_g1_i2.p1  ORF type:complete len:328 (+),score=80.06 TRINITY_DN28511_c0_g1_i2:280-1263(+)